MSVNKMKAVLDILHMTILFSMALPVIYASGMVYDSKTIYVMYLIGYFVLVPFSIVKAIRERCKKVWQYLIGVLSVALAVVAVAHFVSVRLLSENVYWGNMIYIFVALIYVIVKEYLIKINDVYRQRAKEQMDNTWRGMDLDKPQLALSVIYVLVYLLGLFLPSPELCDLSVINMVLHIVVAFAYSYIDKTENYLQINDGTCNVKNIPYKRIYGIGRVFLIFNCVIIAASLIPAFLTVKYRNYRDFKTWVQERVVEIEEPERNYDGVDPMEEVLASYGPIEEPPVWLEMMMNIVMVISFIVFAIIIFKAIRNVIRDFEQNVNEADDIVEMIDSDETEEISNPSGIRFSLHKSDSEKIRIKYKRFIKKYRKEVPASYETPAEIEMLAGVYDMEETKILHRQYEEARYSDMNPLQ